MQRQSLGSPASKLHGHGVSVSKEETIPVEDSKRKLHPLDSASSTSLDEEDRKQTKPHRLSYSPSQPDRIIHLIPVLMLICFLVLYLCSHSPSQSDLVEFGRFKRPPKHIESAEMGDIGRLTEVHKGDVLAIRSLRNLQEIGKRVPKSRSHRKFVDF